MNIDIFCNKKNPNQEVVKEIKEQRRKERERSR
jgi:hypothetical protein